MVQVGMAVQKKYTDKGSRLGIIRYVLHPYCFSLKYYYLKSSRDIRCTSLSLAYYPCLYTLLYCHSYFYHQFYSIVSYACNINSLVLLMSAIMLNLSQYCTKLYQQAPVVAIHLAIGPYQINYLFLRPGK